MRLESWFIGLALLSGMILLGLFIAVDLDDSYVDVDLSEDYAHFSQDLNYTEEAYNTSTSFRTTLLGGEVQDDNTENSLFAGGFSAIKSVTNTFSMFGNFINAIQTEIGFPPFLINIALTVMAFLVVMAVIYLIFRFQPS